MRVQSGQCYTRRYVQHAQNESDNFDPTNAIVQSVLADTVSKIPPTIAAHPALLHISRLIVVTVRAVVAHAAQQQALGERVTQNMNGVED
jgi:hypothetical protein